MILLVKMDYLIDHTVVWQLLEVDAREELDKMKHLEGQDIDLPELLDEYWFLTSCEERRNQLCEQNPFAEDLFRMLDAHMGINPWQNSLPSEFLIWCSHLPTTKFARKREYLETISQGKTSFPQR